MSNLFAPIVRHVIAPLLAFKEGSSYLGYLNVLERSQYLSEEELRHRQWHRLRKIVAHAYANCPFYQRLYQNEGIAPEDLRSWENFQELPTLTRRQIKAEVEDMVAKNVPRTRLFPRKTSGSSGVSLFFYVDSVSMQWKRACAIRHNRWAGRDIGKPVAAIWGNPPTKEGLRAQLKNLLLSRIRYLDTLKMNEHDMEAFARDLIARPAAVLFGHAHSLYLFARFVRARGLKGIVPQGIISTAMVLLEKERHVIESVFRAKVFDRYGCEEVGLIASECERHSGLHVNMDTLVVEVLKNGRPAKPGEVGEVVVSDLTNYGMPFIRYRVGDMAVPSDMRCGCGRGLPLLKKVEGRTADYVVTPDGALISGISLTENFATLLPEIDQIQIVQEKVDFLRLRIVKAEGFGRHSLQRIGALVTKRFGNTMRFECDFVDQIHQEKSGKYRFVISKVSVPFD